VSNLEFRSVTDDEFATYCATVYRGFGEDMDGDGADDLVDRFRAVLPLERTVAAFDDGAIVGTLGDFALGMTLPGGHQAPTAGTTAVTVAPTHRRRGVLREMMQRHLQMALDRGEPVVALWASEPAIYGRFGFGLATERHRIEFDARLVTVGAPADGVKLQSITSDHLIEVVAPMWTAIARRADRPGFIDRSTARWDDLAADPPSERGGATAIRHVVARRDDQVVGYLAYRQQKKWEQLPEGTVSVRAMVAADEQVRSALWHFAANVDLFPIVEFWAAPLDDPVAHESSNAAAVRRTVEDGLYVRILDLERALEARTYEVDDRLVLGVDDAAGFAHGTFELSVTDGKASVSPSDDSPDLRLDVRELGVLLLGRDAAHMLASVGRIQGEPGAVRRLSNLFRTGRAPSCPEMF